MNTLSLNSVISLHDTVGQLVAAKPGRARVFTQWGLDYCCGGKRPIGEACREKGVDTVALLRALNEADATPEPDTVVDWTQVPLTELIDHIVTTHHAYTRTSLPFLSALIAKVNAAHGSKHPELAQVETIFANLRAELEAHTSKEEQEVFPWIAQLEDASLPVARLLESPLHDLEAEHDAAGAAFAQIRLLTQDFTPPANACNTYRAMLHDLAELEADLHQHVHKENNILFPRALAYQKH